MNCSFIHLTNSLYLHSTVIILSLPIHFSAFSLLCLLSLQYCNERAVSCCGLNLLFRISNRPSTVLHNSCASCVRDSIKCRPCLYSQFLIMCTLSELCVLYIWNMLFTPNMKFLNFVYLSVTPQSKVGFCYQLDCLCEVPCHLALMTHQCPVHQKAFQVETY